MSGSKVSDSKVSHKDSVTQTLIVALLLCVVCSVIVSGAAVILKPIQASNKLQDRNKNILVAAGLYKESVHTAKDIEGLFSKFSARLVDLETGDFVSEKQAQTLQLAIESYDQRQAAKDPALSTSIDRKQDIASIKRRARYATVYLVEQQGEIERIVLPVHGYGLWGTLYGFMALEGDANTVIGLGFYEHKETPGLGAEVDNPKWKAMWPGKQVYNAQGQVAVAVVKGKLNPASKTAIHGVDGLSGATLTSRGVHNLLRFWMGEDGFGPFLANLRMGNLRGEG